MKTAEGTQRETARERKEGRRGGSPGGARSRTRGVEPARLQAAIEALPAGELLRRRAAGVSAETGASADGGGRTRRLGKKKKEPGRRARRTTACRPTIPTASSTSMRAGTSAGTGMARTTSLAASAFISAPSRGTVPGFARRRYGAQSYDDDAWWVGNPPRCRARKRRASSRT